MAYRVDLAPGANPHVNYEPSSLGGLVESPKAGEPYEPMISGKLTRAMIDRTNDFGQAGETYRNHEDWEKDELILNLVDTLKPAKAHIQNRMVWLFSQCDADYGRRVAEGLGVSVPSSDPYAAPVPDEGDPMAKGWGNTTCSRLGTRRNLTRV